MVSHSYWLRLQTSAPPLGEPRKRTLWMSELSAVGNLRPLVGALSLLATLKSG